MRAMTSTS